MARAKKSPDKSEVSDEKKLVRKPITKSPDKSGVKEELVREPINKVVDIKSECRYTLVDPNNGRSFPAFSLVKDVVKTNWLEVQVAAKLLKEV